MNYISVGSRLCWKDIVHFELGSFNIKVFNLLYSIRETSKSHDLTFYSWWLTHIVAYNLTCHLARNFQSYTLFPLQYYIPNMLFHASDVRLTDILFLKKNRFHKENYTTSTQ